jgi:uncharacterized membrane protein HdeD (DUF308 family)
MIAALCFGFILLGFGYIDQAQVYKRREEEGWFQSFIKGVLMFMIGIIFLFYLLDTM